MDEALKNRKEYDELLGVNNDVINTKFAGKKLMASNNICKNLRYNEILLRQKSKHKWVRKVVIM